MANIEKNVNLQEEINGIFDLGRQLMDDIGAFSDSLISTTKNLTLSASSWSNGTYTISDTLITATSNQEVLPAVGITLDQLKALQTAMLVDGGQSTGSLTLKAMGTTPAIDIPIRIIFRGVK